MLLYICLSLLFIGRQIKADQYDDDTFMPSSSSSSSSMTTTTNSYDSLISSQCKAKCLSLYPWTNDYTHDDNNKIDESDMKLVRKRHHSQNVWSSLITNTNVQHHQHRKRQRNQDGKSLNQQQQQQQHHFNVKWHKVMELCSKNANCLQCSLPCEIPTNLLSNCKYLCKNRHPLCIESCNLLTKLSQEKQGTCPSTPSRLPTKQINGIEEKCTNNTSISTSSSCSKDSDCVDTNKCCSIDTACPQYGNVCKRPQLNAANIHMPSVPFNLSIVERKKGKTIILSWDCNYNKNKPTMFVVEGRWSLNSPPSSSNIANHDNGNDNYMTKWGYLAQTVNNNWIILRSINRGRWYKFRVAAISKSGTHGYSAPTELFILSSPPKPPSQPQNLTVNKVYAASNKDKERVDVDISWIPSKRSDLPITNYKVTWAMMDDENGDELNSVNHGGQDLIDAQNLNKYTIHNLFKNAHYSIELAAQSTHEQNMLVSSPIRVTIDTTINLDAYTLKLKAANQRDDEVNVMITKTPLTHASEYDDDEEDEDEDLDTKPTARHSQNNELNLPQVNAPKRPIIKNLLVQTPYFQNGLVKAKLSWQTDNNMDEKKEEITNSKMEASINAKTIIDQPMFTITWFAIKCVKSDDDQTNVVTMSQRLLPTPITATTINTHFEIYELKYNCDYVVNVRLAAPVNTLPDSFSSSLKRPIPPQIASTQFKVPSCSQIKLVGRIQPMCFEKTSIESIVNKNLYSIFSTSKTTSSISSSLSTFVTTTTEKPFIQLPHVYNIRYKIVNRSPQNLYAVEFSWSQPSKLVGVYTGYQISVVPKAIPGFGMAPFEGAENTFVGSVSAIVDKEQQSFIVRQLRPSVRYIFQIQTINKDEQVNGPPNSLEFLIESQDVSSTLKLASSHHDQQKLLQIKLKDALRSSMSLNDVESVNNDDSTLLNARLSTSRPSFLNNGGGNKFSCSLFSLLVKSVFFVCFSCFLIETRLKT